MDTSLSKLPEMVKDREAGCAVSMRSHRVRHDLVTEQQHKYIFNIYWVVDSAVFYVQWGEMYIQGVNQLHFVFSVECVVKYCFFAPCFLASMGASENQSFVVV